MMLNKFGAFVAGRNKVRLIPFKHHLCNSWMVMVITGQIDPLFYYYAVWGGDNEQAAENAYNCYLKEREDAKRLKDAPMKELNEAKMKHPRKYTKYKDVTEA